MSRDGLPSGDVFPLDGRLFSGGLCVMRVTRTLGADDSGASLLLPTSSACPGGRNQFEMMRLIPNAAPSLSLSVEQERAATQMDSVTTPPSWQVLCNNNKCNKHPYVHVYNACVGVEQVSNTAEHAERAYGRGGTAE